MAGNQKNNHKDKNHGGGNNGGGGGGNQKNDQHHKKDKNNGGGGGGNNNNGGKGAQQNQISFDDIGQPIKLDEGAINKQAASAVESSYAPQIQEIQRQMTGAGQDTAAHTEAIGNIYDAFGKAVAPLDNSYQQQMGDISKSYTGSLKDLTNMLGTSSSPAGELAAAGGLFGDIGAAGLSGLANEQTRNVGYNTSAERQGSIESVVAKGNAAQDLADQLKVFRQQLADTRANQARDTLNQTNTLEDTKFQQQLAQQELFLRQKALQAQVLSDKALRGYYSDLTSKNNGSGNNGSGSGNHNNGNGSGNHNDGNGSGNHNNGNGSGNHNGDGGGNGGGNKGLLTQFLSGDMPWSDMSGTQQKRVKHRITPLSPRNLQLSGLGIGPNGTGVPNMSALEIIRYIREKLYGKTPGGGGSTGGNGNDGGWRGQL